MCNIRFVDMKKLVRYVYSKLIDKSPWIEILLRHIYWHNYSLLHKYKPSYKGKVKSSNKCDFSALLSVLDGFSLRGKIVIVHSSYDELESTGLSPEEIVDKLIDYLGPESTLMMPCLRKFKEMGKKEDILKKDLSNVLIKYDVRKSPVVSGFLPFALLRKEGSCVSRFPLTPVVAYGKYAKEIVEHNIDGDFLTSHGPNSSWKFCYDHDAVVIGLGVVLNHFLSIIHVREDNDPDWPVRDWYRELKFDVVDGDFHKQISVHERKPKWGLLYSPDGVFKRDMYTNRIIKVNKQSGIDVSIAYSSDILDFIKIHPNRTYPFYIPKKYYK